MKKKVTAVLLIVTLFFGSVPMVFAAEETKDILTMTGIPESSDSRQTANTAADSPVKLTAPSAILMESENGTVIMEQNADERRPIASITKIMTLLLIFEALDSGKISLSDVVTVSEHAASMGGSQVFLEPYETQSVETMIKCITISSANDACVAMAEHLAGSEEAFVALMNEKATELGMKQTTFVNCCGLDVSGHLSSARDVALMSCALMKHPDIKKYTTVWMDTITHTTRRGESEFGLTNTNKLIKQYNGITGLKTGSTGEAKYCLSATAERNGVKLVAVVLAAPDPKARFREAAALLDYGFANCISYTDDHSDFPETLLPVKKGSSNSVPVQPSREFCHIFTSKTELSQITEEPELPESINAPIKKGTVVGRCIYRYNGEEIGSVPIVTMDSVEKMTFGSSLRRSFTLYFHRKQAYETSPDKALPG